MAKSSIKIKVRFKEALMNVHSALISSSPISELIYSILMLTPAILLTCLPIQLVFSNEREPYFQVLYLNSFPRAVKHSSILILTILIFILSLYLASLLVIILRQDPSKDSQKKNNYAALSKIIISLFIFYHTLVQHFAKALSILILVNNYFLEDQDSDSILTIIAIIILSLDFIVELTFCYLLANIYPIESIPWAQFKNQAVLYQLSNYITALALVKGYGIAASPYLTGIAFAFSLVNLINPVHFHSKLVSSFMFLANSLCQSALLTLLIISIDVHENNSSEASKMIPLQIISFLIFFIGGSMYHKLHSEKILSSTIISDQASQAQWFQHIILELQKYKISIREKQTEKSSQQKVTEFLMFLTTSLSRHSRYCKSDICPCQGDKFNEYLQIKIDMSLIEMQEYALRQLEMLVKIHANRKLLLQPGIDNADRKNSNLQLLRLYFQLYLSEKPFLTMFECQQGHNCNKCTYFECFQNYQLKQLIMEEYQQLQQKASRLDNQLDFSSKYYIYEIKAKKLQTVIEEATDQVSTFWNGFLRLEQDLGTVERFASQLVRLYRLYSKCRDLLIENCEEFNMIHQMSFRFHSAVLNFELEAQEDFYKLQQDLQQMKIKHRNNEESFDLKQGLIVISLDTDRFANIEVVSKHISELTGYSEETLLRNKLPLILPEVVNACHGMFLERYLNYSLSEQRQSAHSNNDILFLQTKQGSIKLVNVSIIPKISPQLTIQMFGLIKEVSQVEIYHQKLPIKNVYLMLCDYNCRILHFSTNFVEQFKVKEDIQSRDLIADQVISQLPDDPSQLNQNQLFILNLKEIVEDSEYGYLQSLKTLKIQVYAQELKCNQESLKLYFFVLAQNQVESSDQQQQNNNALSVKEKGKSENENIKSHSSSSSGQIQFDDSSSAQILSVSDSSHSGQQAKECIEISEIKGIDGLKTKIKFIKNLRIYFFFCLALLLVLGGTFFLINHKIQRDYNQMLNEVVTVKQLKGAIGYNTLISLNQLILENLPDTFDESELVQDLEYQKGLYATLMISVDSIMTQSIQNFSIAAMDFSESFEHYVSHTVFHMTTITQSGHLVEEDVTFKEAINLYSHSCSSFIDIELENLTIPWDLMLPDFQQYAQDAQIQDGKNDFGRIIRLLFYITHNGGDHLFNALFEMDSYYLDTIHESQDYFSIQALSISITSVILIVICGLAILPVLLKVQQQQLILMEVLTSIEREELREILTQLSTYESQSGQSSSKQVRGRCQPSQENQDRNNQSQVESSMTMLNKNFSSMNTTQFNKGNKGQGKDGSNQKGKAAVKKQMMKRDREEAKLEGGLQKVEKKKNVKEEEEGFQIEEEKIEEEPPMKFTTIINQREEVTLSSKKKTLMKSQIRSKKIQIMSFIMLFCVLLSFYFGALYYLQENLNSGIQEGFTYLDVFFQNTPCLFFSYFLYQNAILFNISLSQDTEYGEAFQNFQDLCTENDLMYKQLQLGSQSMFVGIQDVLNTIDSSDFCSYSIDNGYSRVQNCSTVEGGIFELGAAQASQIFETHLNHKTVMYESMEDSKRDLETLKELFFDPEVLNFVMLIINQLGFVYYNLQLLIHQEFTNSMEDKNGVFAVCFIIFAVVVFGLECLMQAAVIMKINEKILGIKMVLKIVPAHVLLRQKRQVERLKDRRIFNID